jgi:hypothetical protein
MYSGNHFGNMPVDEKPKEYTQGIQIKEEMRKESSSPDNTKAVSYMEQHSNKLEHFHENNSFKQKPIKTEPKDVKLESGQPSNLPPPPGLSIPYPGAVPMSQYARHLSSMREEDLQK